MKAIYEPTGKAREFGDLACNLYKGCSHGCNYCYATGVLRMSKEDFSKPEPRKGVLEQLEKDAAKHEGSRIPIFLCFTSDPYQIIETEHNITREALLILQKHGCAINVLTKGGTRACKDFDILASDPGNWFGTTLTYASYHQSFTNEPLARSPQNRIHAIYNAKKSDINTWVSLEPIISKAEALSLIKDTLEFVDLYKIGKMNHRTGISEAELRSFLAEAVNLLDKNKKKYYIKLDTRPFLGI